MKSCKKFLSFLLALALLLAPVCLPRSAADEPPVIEAGIAGINKHGNIILTISSDSMTALGFEPADIISVKIGEAEMEMPIGTSYSDVDAGDPVCCFKTASDGTRVVVLAINTGNFAAAMGMAGDGSAPAFDSDVTVTISMAAKQGYAEAYALHRLTGTRSNKRGDYPDLSDAAYANFRAVETSGMGAGMLYRSSSPINPAINRNREADEALFQAMIRTVINMADSEKEMRAFPDYALTHYAACDIIALDMGMSPSAKSFQRKLANGLRFILTHDGPYLLHCKEGKDRTGFAAAVLECLMGADADEVVRDYMLSYYNYYGVEPGTPSYDLIASGNIEAILAKAFRISSIRDEDADLRALAEAYLEGIGLSGDEIAQLKVKLGTDFDAVS